MAFKEKQKTGTHFIFSLCSVQSSHFNSYNPATNEELSACDVRIHASKFGADRENTLRAESGQRV